MPPVTGKKTKTPPVPTPSSPNGEPLRPYWATSDGETVRLYLGEVRDVLARLPTRSVQCVVTSPPYWGLRSYLADGHEHKGYEIGSEPSPDCGTSGQAQCHTGGEGGCFVCTMVAVFRGVRRVLRDDGCVFLNLGDTYGGGKSGRTDNDRISGPDGTRMAPDGSKPTKGGGFNGVGKSDLPSGNLVGVPWRVALALQADGWVLRQDIIWAKPSPMPESVTNRCTKAHEYVFLLTKGERYYYDAEAIKEKAKHGEAFHGDYHAPHQDGTTQQISKRNGRHDGTANTVNNSNKRSVWTISSQGYPGAHFATFPPKLVEPCILAGTSEKGACAVCGAPWGRVVESSREATRPAEVSKVWEVRKQLAVQQGGKLSSTLGSIVGNRDPERHCTETRMVGWAPGCRCGSEEVRPCVVLDPFIGSGTTCAVANDLGRWGWGVDLSEDYLRNHAIPRVEGALLRRPGTSGLTGRVRRAVTGLGKPVDVVRGGRANAAGNW